MHPACSSRCRLPSPPSRPSGEPGRRQGGWMGCASPSHDGRPPGDDAGSRRAARRCAARWSGLRASRAGGPLSLLPRCSILAPTLITAARLFGRLRDDCCSWWRSDTVAERAAATGRAAGSRCLPDCRADAALLRRAMRALVIAQTGSASFIACWAPAVATRSRRISLSAGNRRESGMIKPVCAASRRHLEGMPRGSVSRNPQWARLWFPRAATRCRRGS